MTTAHSPGVGELIERSTTSLTVLLGALKTIHSHEALLSPRVRDAILRSALRHGMELQSLMERARTETAPQG